MRKATALIFLLLANVIMLAHTFVPHCDYGQTSVITPLSLILSENDGHCSSCCHHSHDIEEECFLTQKYVKIDNDDETALPANVILQVCQFISVNNFVTAINSESLSFQYKPYLLTYYCAFVLPTIGLRAPPAC
ncbi:MAG: hypothetical protein LBP63_02670 [Prevotellaceae bacterium]|jgi:hypothetical protein|nr:hypothetical protein [Prevotellaceae bacterium]